MQKWVCTYSDDLIFHSSTEPNTIMSVFAHAMGKPTPDMRTIFNDHLVPSLNDLLAVVEKTNLYTEGILKMSLNINHDITVAPWELELNLRN